MLQVARWRVILVLVVTALGLLFAAPNVLPQNVRESLPSFLAGSTMNLGLDLRGGSHILLEADTEALRRQRLDQVSDDISTALRNADPQIRATRVRGANQNVIIYRLNEPADIERAMTAVQNVSEPMQGTGIGTNIRSVDIVRGEGGTIEASISDEAMRLLARQAVSQSIEVIRRRIDPNGVSEVTIVPQGDARIVVQAPGETDPNALRERLNKTAQLTFHMPAEGVSVDEAKARPQTYRILPFFNQEENPGGAMIIQSRARITGDQLLSAQAGFDSRSNQPVVNFRFNNRAAQIFCTLTQQNVGKPFAIVLDDRILSAPNINEPICGGSGQISNIGTPAQVQELSLLLRAGALPVPLRVMEERSVGAELGQDAINGGVTSGIIAGIATLVFMVLAYGLFGLIACVALVVNGILVVAAMSLVGAALTLPGIAGLILTIAMAVDANVLIYERMREEQHNGRGPAMAIDAGFNRAMVTIVDANLTTILAALILFWFGVGPVRGFAWTLSIGVVTSVFTAVLITQILIALWFRATRPKKLPI